MRLFTLIAISTLLVLLCPSIARGQYRDTTETSMMTYRKGHLELQGSRLGNEEVRMLVGDDYAKYCRGRKQRIAGCILTPIGACTLGASLYLSYVGLITTAFGKPVPLYAGIALNAFGGACPKNAPSGASTPSRVAQKADRALNCGLFGQPGGGGVLASGIATLRGVRSNLKEIASGYNSGKTGTEVSFGPTGNGIGIAVRF